MTVKLRARDTWQPAQIHYYSATREYRVSYWPYTAARMFGRFDATAYFTNSWDDAVGTMRHMNVNRPADLPAFG